MHFGPGTRIAVVAPHPDDDVLGCGGTMIRAARAGATVDVIVVTRGRPPLFDERLVAQIRQETLASHADMGVRQTHFLDFPAAALDQVPRAELNQALAAVLDSLAPELLFVPFVGDIHLDHQIVFSAAMVYARPRSERCPNAVLAYETLSETNWLAPGITPGFQPNIFVDISDTLDAKLEAFKIYSSQQKASPDERSFETIRALAVARGATVYRHAAEAFVAIRQIF
jgi:LmbE family N-acetylglucosaminyl deacetylase